MALGAVSQQRIQRAYGRRQIKQVCSLPLDAVAQLPNLPDPLSAVVDKRAAQHLGILNGISMDQWAVDVGIHDLQVPFSDVSGGGGGRDQMRPCIPVVDERFKLDIL